MSFLGVLPDLVAAAAGNVESIGSSLSAAHAAAAAPTTELLPAAADEVSAAITAVFGAHGRHFQSLGAQAEAFHQQFTSALSAGAAAYSRTEAEVQQNLQNAVNAPVRALLEHPLMGPESAGPGAAAASGGLAPLLIGGSEPSVGVPISYPLAVDTPFGPLELMLNGTMLLPPPLGYVEFHSGSLSAPAPFVYGVGAIGPAVATMSALQNSNTAFLGAVQSGNLLGAVGSLIQAPGNAVNGFFFGQTAIPYTMPGPSGFGYESVGVSVPVGGLLAPLQPVTVTFTPTSGTPTAIQLSGTRFGGLIPALFQGVGSGF